MPSKVKQYGGARTNSRIIKIRDEDELSRGDIAKLTRYSRGVVDNWLGPTSSDQWRRAPVRAVILLEFETGRRYPSAVTSHFPWLSKVLAERHKERSDG